MARCASASPSRTRSSWFTRRAPMRASRWASPPRTATPTTSATSHPTPRPSPCSTPRARRSSPPPRTRASGSSRGPTRATTASPSTPSRSCWPRCWKSPHIDIHSHPHCLDVAVLTPAQPFDVPDPWPCPHITPPTHTPPGFPLHARGDGNKAWGKSPPPVQGDAAWRARGCCAGRGHWVPRARQRARMEMCPRNERWDAQGG
mmetsp:Transcript_43330/g.115933  ORF Transcript_43330/g.115933 Transcript_43330/m.115933 type:complete len:203 (-) Transcript_43330:70-678(-)